MTTTTHFRRAAAASRVGDLVRLRSDRLGRTWLVEAVRDGRASLALAAGECWSKRRVEPLADLIADEGR